MRQTFREGLSHLKHYREGLSHLKHYSQMRPIRHPNYPQMRQMRIPLSKIISRIIIDIIITQHKSNDYSPSYGAKSCFICANCSQIRPMGSHLCKSLIDETDETHPTYSQMRRMIITTTHHTVPSRVSFVQIAHRSDRWDLIYAKHPQMKPTQHPKYSQMRKMRHHHHAQVGHKYSHSYSAKVVSHLCKLLTDNSYYGVATISRLLKIIGLVCKGVL